ncbi:NAD(P)-binding protein [Candidatus Woesearchaeota archaeon]|nr:NAD(P)-binding protein [Candidatus Woesearchaeota archaeon]
MKIVILGGGLAGLAAGDILSKYHQVLILEKNSFLGGLAASFKQSNEWIPLYYHHVIKHNTITQQFLNRFNLLKNAVWKKIKVVIGVKTRIHDITNPFGLLGFNYISLWGRLRFGIFGLYALFFLNPEKLSDKLDAKTWLYKFGGKEVTGKIFENLYARNKFNVPLQTISAKQLANRLKEREVYDYFTYPPKGLQLMIDGLEKTIKKNKGIITKNASVVSIDLKKQKIVVNGKTKSFDLLINTIPIPEFLKLTKGLPQDYTLQLSKLRYCPLVNVTFGTKEFLDNRYYWTNLFGERVHTLFQHSILCDKYSSKINWVLRYGGSEEDFKLSDNQIITDYLETVKKYFPKMQVTWAKVFREKYGEPIYDKEFENYKPHYITPVKGLYMAGIQVTHPKIRNMNSALESGQIVAKIISDELKEIKSFKNKQKK